MRDDLLGGRYVRVLGRRTGIINEISVQYPDRGGPPVYVSSPDLADVARLSGTDGTGGLNVGGKGTTLEESLLTCVGEAVERYCLLFPPSEEELVRGSYEEVRSTDETIDYGYLDSYNLETNDAMSSLSRRTTLNWAAGTNLLDETSVLLPDSLVWFHPDRDERYLLSHSNGCAAGQRKDRAVVEAIFEAVERDGLMRTWCLQSSPTRIREVPDETRPLVSEFEDRGYEIQFYLLESTVDVPVVGCLLEDRSESLPDCVFCCAAGFDIAEAMNDTLVEAGQGWVLARSSLPQYDVSEINSKDQFEGHTENFLYYSCGEGTEVLMDLLDVEDSTCLDRIDTPETRTELFGRLDSQNCRPIAFDLTTRDVRDAGLFVTRVFVPELIPLTPPSDLPTKHPELINEDVTTLPHPYA